MQNNGRQGRGRRGRRRGGDGEQQPLTNESTTSLLHNRKRRSSQYSQPPSAYDPYYVRGQNPQYSSHRPERAFDEQPDPEQPLDSSGRSQGRNSRNQGNRFGRNQGGRNRSHQRDQSRRRGDGDGRSGNPNNKQGNGQDSKHDNKRGDDRDQGRHFESRADEASRRRRSRRPEDASADVAREEHQATVATSVDQVDSTVASSETTETQHVAATSPERRKRGRPPKRKSEDIPENSTETSDPTPIDTVQESVTAEAAGGEEQDVIASPSEQTSRPAEGDRRDRGYRDRGYRDRGRRGRRRSHESGGHQRSHRNDQYDRRERNDGYQYNRRPDDADDQRRYDRQGHDGQRDRSQRDGQRNRNQRGGQRHGGQNRNRHRTGDRRQGQRHPRPDYNGDVQPLTSESPLTRQASNRRGNQGRPGRKGSGKGRMSFGVAKRRTRKEPGRSTVYTSDMFMYKENLDPRKPSERKMRSRRHKPDSDSKPSEE